MELNVYLSACYWGEGGWRTVEERDVDEKGVRDDFRVAAVACSDSPLREGSVLEQELDTLAALPEV